ncbi:MAG: DUF1186 family protein [Tannerella sp.]|nr:DUF1186 family protein [Tannerella sp.]
MAKKKAKQQNQLLSPEKYIKTRARMLPIGECLIRREWQKYGMTDVIVPRIHQSGNTTIGVYLLDIFCLGVKDTMYMFNLEPHEYEDFLSTMFSDGDYDVVTYEEVHNIIYGAIEYAEELGFKPEKTFAITKYILEEDTEDIPLIEYEFGKDGKPFLITKSRFEYNKYFPTLEKNVGSGNFDFLILDEEEDDEYDDDDDDDDDWDFDDDDYWDRDFENSSLVSTEYDYHYPEYPQELSLTHPELYALFLPEYIYSLPKEKIGTILSLPHDSLINDLTHIILYETGNTIRYVEDGYPGERDFHSAIMHSLFILGELKAERSLDVVLETMRQNEGFNNVNFGDSTSMVLPLTLYYTGRNQLPKLMDYLKEPSLNPFFRFHVFDAVVIIARNEPERKDEIIQWFRDVLTLYIENAHDDKIFDSNLAGLLISSLIDLKAVELLPEILTLFNTNQVDLHCAGDYKEVEMSILSDESCLVEDKLLNIYERYEEYEKTWNYTDSSD